MESPSSRASPQINIDKDIYEKQKKWKIVHCAVKWQEGVASK